MNTARYLLILAIALTMTLSGCADLKYKFVRKKSPQESVPRYHAVRQYDVKPSVELYTKRFIFWRNFHEDLLNILTDSNHKKAEVAADQALSNMMDMQKMLVDEKAEELQKVIDKMTAIEKEIKTRRVTTSNEARLRSEIELVGKKIRGEFNEKAMAGYLAREFRPGEPIEEEEEE